MLRWLIPFGFVFLPGLSQAADDRLCDHAAAAAAAGSDVPEDLLRALTRVETGRTSGGRFSPWPWTVNMEGAGHWFETRAQALAFVMKHYNRGARSFDIGCFQINYRWHGEAFEGIAAMFDPLINARYAAQFLTELKPGGGWRRAVGRYHSKTPKYAQKYTARFDRIHAALPVPERQIVHRVAAPPAPATQNLAAVAPPQSAEARGLAHLAFLAPPSGAAFIQIAQSETNLYPSPGGVGVPQNTSRGGMLTPAKRLLN